MKNSDLHIPTAVDIYREGDLRGLHIEEVCQSLGEKARIPVRFCGDLFEKLTRERVEALAKELAGIRVKDPQKRFTPYGTFQAEIDYEERRIRDPGWKTYGILYEGALYQSILSRLIDEGGTGFNPCVILFTNQLFGTWDRNDLRYHARVSLYGFPHLISTTGLVIAPAKPKAFYLRKQMGSPEELLREEYQGRFLDHGDPRMTEVMKGYAMQAFFFCLSGNPFCDDPGCRLFNSHWQEEVLHSQLDGPYEYCPGHEAILKEVRLSVHQSDPIPSPSHPSPCSPRWRASAAGRGRS